MTIISDLSLNKAQLVLSEVALEDVQAMARVHDLPEVVARLLCVRGIGVEEAETFLHPTLRDHFPDPFSLADMDKAAEFVAEAIQGGRQIAIFGDFDVDGATSSAVLFRFLKACGVKAPIYIPDRLAEGYGPNLEALKSLKDKGAEIVLMLDCGTTAFDIVKQGREIGLDILILDHHEAEDELPAANFVINPKRKDDTSDLDVLAAVGVTFLFCVAVNKVLRTAGFFEGRDAPDLKFWLDIVALGTVCDMVPLSGANRLFVRHGFAMMARTGNVGLRALLDVAKVTEAPNPYHAGFVLGPRINAGSRVHEADLGARLLSTEDAEEANNIAWTLDDCNAKRKSIQATMEREALQMVEDRGLDQDAVIIVDHEDWHPGLSGLVAGAIKEKFKKPACVVTYARGLDDKLEGRGSGRSVAGIHIAQAFIDARNAGLLVKGGGHAMAAGFTVEPDKLDALRVFLNEHIAKQAESADTNVVLSIDSVVSVRGATLDLVKMLEGSVGPFGQGFDAPVFMLRNVRLHSVDIVGANHVRMQVSDWEGGSRMKVMAFRALDTDLGDALFACAGGGRAIDLVGALKLNCWQGRESVEMHLQDAVFSSIEGAAAAAG